MTFKRKTIVLFLGVAIIIISGCSTKERAANLETKKNDYLKQESFYEKAKSHQGNVQFDKKVSVKFRNTPIFIAIQKALKGSGIVLDETFAPSRDYRITTNYKGSIRNFLALVYRQTGVDYKYRAGLLTVFNKDLIIQEYKAKKCTDKGAENFSIKLKRVPPSKVIEYFEDSRGFTVAYDQKYMNVSGNDLTKIPMNVVNFSYKGCDEKEAIHKFAKANDLSVSFSSSKSVVFSDYESIQLDIPTYFDLDFSSEDSGLKGGDTESGGSGSGSRVSEKENNKKEIQALIGNYLSEHGKAFLSNRGYLAVTDVPSAIKDIKLVVQKEIIAQQSLELSMSIVRVSIGDNFESGVDWSLALQQLGSSLNVRNLAVGLNYADMIDGGLSISGIANNKEQIIKVLSQYGEAKIVRNYSVRTRSGIMSTFKAVDNIPYITTSVVASGDTFQTVTEAHTAEAGLIFNIKPTLSQNNEIVNFAIDITISEYLGDKVFQVDGGEYSLPRITSNTIKMPANVPINKTVILTGLKFKQNQTEREGIPVLSNLDTFGGLFGMNKEDLKNSEFLLVITPKSTWRF